MTTPMPPTAEMVQYRALEPASEPGSASLAGGTPRVASVDVLRGLTIFLMVFVNDLGPAAPSWLHHINPPRLDGMTVADGVFPFFLFIVGVSIPLAFEQARAAGASTWGRLGHIVRRTASLLVMGVIEFNHDNDLKLGGRLWGLLAFTSLILAWCSVPRAPGWRRTTFLSLKGLGSVGLLALLAIFRRAPIETDLLGYGPVANWVWFRSGWWGILGLIGWAYLTVAILFLMVGRRREWLMGALALLMLTHLATHDGGFFDRVEHKDWLGPALGPLESLRRAVNRFESFVGYGDALGSLAAITMAGCLLGSILRRDSLVQAPRERLAWAGMFAGGLFLAGVMTDTFEGINKIAATPTWCFLSAALATLVWIGLYAVIDVAGWRGWAFFLRPAGANPLLAYFLHPITIWLVGLAGLGDAVLGYTGSSSPGTVVSGSAGMALFVCTITGLLGWLGLRVRV